MLGGEWSRKGVRSTTHTARKPFRTVEGTMQERGLGEASNWKSDDSGGATNGDMIDGADDDRDGGLEDDAVTLRNYCLIAADEIGDEFKMHRLVQLLTRRWLEAFRQQETFKQQWIERIAVSLPTGQYEN